MKPYNSELFAPYFQFSGSRTMLVSRDTRSVPIQGLSPRVNGKLKIRPNPLNTTKTDYRSSAGWVLYARARETNSVGFPEYSSLWTYLRDSNRNRLRQEAMNEWISKVSQSATNLIDFYRTRKETIDMVAGTVRRLALAYRNVRKGRWRNVCEILSIDYKKPTRKNRSNPPQAWLEYTYGWSPLVGSVYQMLDKTFPEPIEYIRKSVNTTVNYIDNSKWTAGVKGSSSIDFRARCTVTGWIKADGTALQALSTYGITNPALAVWEALPYSFVVDWFIPVGDYLNSLSAYHGVSVFDTSVSYTFEFNAHGHAYPDPSATGAQKVILHGAMNGSIKVRGCDRTVEVPQYTFPKPQNGLSLSRFASALSLLAGEMGRRIN